MDDKELIERLESDARFLATLGSAERCGSVRLAAARLTALAEENERLRKALVTLECPCCGEEAAIAKFFEDGQATICGCGGIIMCDGETAYVSVDQCERTECGPDDTAISEVPR